VEGLTRVHGVDVLVTEEVKAALDPRFRLRAMPPQPVKGKAEPIATYHVEGLAAERAAAPGKAARG
jgi:class 3 adenylate cyclase